jgi:hypothetical protein
MTRLHDGTISKVGYKSRQDAARETRRILSGRIQPRVEKFYRFRELESVRVAVRHVADDH